MGVRSCPVDFTPLLDQLRHRPAQIIAALQGSSLALCSGNRALLGAWLPLTLTTPCSEQPGLTVVGAATTAAEGLELVRRHGPTLLLCTEQLEQGDGVSLVEAVKRQQIPTRTLLMVSEPPQPPRVRRAIAAGCDGLCLESRVGQGTLLAAVQCIGAGGVYRDRALAALGAEAGGADGDAALSPREVEVLERLQRGLSNRQIAAELYLSPDTVKSHVRHLLQKLGARRRGHAAVLALRRGLID